MEQIEGAKNSDLGLISTHRNALMGIAALIICYFHEFLPAAPAGTFLYDAEDFIIRVSFYGVDVFMLLSGMSVACSLLRKPSVKTFYLRRAKRILPFYFLSGIVMILMGKWVVSDYFLNIFGINFFIKHVDSYLWFVIAIILFYLAAPLYQKLLVKFDKPVLTYLISFAGWYVISLALTGVIRDDFFYAIGRMPVFMLGMLLGNLITTGVKIKYRFAFWTAVVTMFIIGWIMSYMQNYYSYIYLFGTILSVLPRVCLGFSVPYICAGLLDIIKFKWIGKVFEFFGSFCFELYIVQKLFDQSIHYFLQANNIWGIVRNLIMLFTLSAIAFLSSRAVNWCVDKIACSLDINKQNK